MRRKLLWLVLFSAFAITMQATVLENQYIKIIVNDGPHDTGRFTLETTGGDPLRPEDDYQELLFGGADPWSSYTTVRVDGVDYLFGGPTQRRAGFQLPVGERISGPSLLGQSIQTSYLIAGVEVRQVLSIVRSSTTDLPDTMQIQYFLTNRSGTAKKVGIRVLLDTKLGKEDGAPIRLGEQVITTETALYGGQIPQFWQAFDNLEAPRVIAQGTLQGGELTPPNAVLIANWGTLADKSWQTTLRPGQGFIREGEDEPDTAFALFWEDQLPFGSTKRYTTHYGLGGVTISRGRLGLGVTSPREVVRGENFTITAYIENLERGAVENGWIKLDLPPGFRATRPSVRELGQVRGPQTVEWIVFAGETAQSGASFTVTVGGDHCDPVVAKREVRIVGPPRIELSCEMPKIQERNGRWVLAGDKGQTPIWIFPVQVKLRNTGDSKTTVEVHCRDLHNIGLALDYDRYKFIGTLEPKQSYEFVWYFAPVGFGGQIGSFVLDVDYQGQRRQVRTFLDYPKLPAKMEIRPRKTTVAVRETIGLDLWAQNLPALAAYEFRVNYDSEKLRPVTVSGGTAIRGGTFTWEVVKPGELKLVGSLGGARDLREDTLATVYFETLAPGESEVRVTPLNPPDKSLTYTIRIGGAN